MSKATHIISNGNYVVGVLWENEKLGKVLVTTGAKIDPNCDLEIRTAHDGQTVKNIDLRDFLLECLPAN